ncbi:threonine/serine exporter family protein [Nocardia arthritidis]|uniref:Threonine/serine exporter-like N-terminal domain-containing protein n=1 Tax=Nocardia arthritidis TaxID=228602 RepID=A0A6G9YEE5_9NOCA|nr:threonine/serine exporter family protein [Nocardia arthritidis]QIS11447.1 hypothetical protein F5544_17865 [Nocardia arthritidis]
MPDTDADGPPAYGALDFLTRLTVAMLESGSATDAVVDSVGRCAVALGVRGATVVTLGRVVTIDHAVGNRHAVTRVAMARSLDIFDCDRMRRLDRVAKTVIRERPETARATALLADALRARPPWPWWVVPGGGALLAVCIALQVGGSPTAAALAAVVLIAVNLIGRGVGRLRLPSMYTVAAQSAATVGLGAALYAAGLLPITGTAVLIATNWLLLMPIPQLLLIATDAVGTRGLTALERAASAGVAVIGIGVGGALALAASHRVVFDGPIHSELPVLPVWLALIFAILAAVGNAVFNRGGPDLLIPAAIEGLVTGAIYQVLVHAAEVKPLIAAPLTAVVLGFAAGIVADRFHLPVTAMALIGITGALLPGLTVYQGLISELFHRSGFGFFAQAVGICVALGAGAALGVALYVRSIRRV